AASLPTLRSIEQSVVGNASSVYATSPASAAQIAASTSIQESEIGLLPIPVDSAEFAPEDDAEWLQRATEAPLIGFVGRASGPRKNVALLLAAFRLVREELPTANLILVGEPPTAEPEAGVEATGV